MCVLKIGFIVDLSAKMNTFKFFESKEFKCEQ